MNQKTLEDIMWSDRVLEELSLYNLVNFYEKELHAILAGERVGDVFTTSNNRKTLIKYGILSYDYGEAGKRTFIPEKVRRILEEESLE